MIRLTELAASKVKEFIGKRGHGIGIRLGIKTSGCSGLAYVLEYVDQKQDTYQLVYQDNGIEVFVDARDLVYLDGLSLDWQRQGLNEGFQFNNPNEKSACGCGKTFSV